MLNIKIFDVDHGFCAVIEADNRHTILLDCGYGFRTGFRPARYLLNHRSQHIDYLIVPAYTEGHLVGFSDFINHFLERYFSIDCFVTNPSINFNSVEELLVQNPGIGQDLKLLCKANYGQRRIDQSIQWGNCSLSFFWNSYPNFLDIRNLSLVTFLSYQNTHIIFPSDLKTEGWRNLLKNPKFCDRLRQVNLFVASNHGQDDGYCPEVFNYCAPDLVMISNRMHQPLPSSMLRQYERHARGLRTTQGSRKVLTTRDAGTITIQTNRTESLQVMTQKHKVYQYQTS